MRIQARVCRLLAATEHGTTRRGGHGGLPARTGAGQVDVGETGAVRVRLYGAGLGGT